MIELEKDSFMKINGICYLFHVKKLGSEEYFYAVGIISDPPKFKDHGFSIYGFGKTSMEAIWMALDHLCESALRSIPIYSIPDLTISEINDLVYTNEGHIEWPPNKVMLAKEYNNNYMCSPMFIKIKDNKCYPTI
jgi:hypothetical protein